MRQIIQGTDPDPNLNYFTWSQEENYWIHQNEEFKNWKGTIHNDQFLYQNLKEKRKTEDKCTKYEGSAKFNGFTREVNKSIPIKYYKDQYREHSIRNGIWDAFSLPTPPNKENKWDLILQQSIFTLDYTKHHVKSLQKVSEADQYVVQNLAWSVVYLIITLSNTLLQKVLTLVHLTETGPGVFVCQNDYIYIQLL